MALTWTLDLDSEHAIREIDVFPYFGDGRYYQYVVETSADKQAWSVAADRSSNTSPSTARGDRIKLASAVTARFVRVRMLRNSANIGVHLLEVRVY